MLYHSGGQAPSNRDLRKDDAIEDYGWEYWKTWFLQQSSDQV